MQSSYDGKLCYNAVYSQWGRKKHITDAQKERERERERESTGVYSTGIVAYSLFNYKIEPKRGSLSRKLF